MKIYERHSHQKQYMTERLQQILATVLEIDRNTVWKY